MINKIKNFLNQSYPVDYNFEKLVKVSAGCGLFITLFQYIFDPFGKDGSLIPFIDNLLLIGYGLVTFTVLFFVGILLLYFFPSIFNEDNWKVKNEIMASIVVLFIIGLANAIYNGMINFIPFSIKLFLDFQIYTFFVGFFPTIFFTIMEQYWQLKKNLKTAQEIRDKLSNRQPVPNESNNNESVLLASDNDKEHLELKYKNLLFIKSVGNYIEVYFKNNDKVDSYILRSSLKRIEDSAINNKSICRSHRAYLVNLKNIYNVRGNSQGYQLEFQGTDKYVPVSRKYLRDIRDIILQ